MQRFQRAILFKKIQSSSEGGTLQVDELWSGLLKKNNQDIPSNIITSKRLH